MNISEVRIKAFKSIKNQVIKLDLKCIGLVGINESGKTNVLKAVSLIDVNNKFSKSDIPKDSLKTQPRIEFDLEPSKSDLGQLRISIDNFNSEFVRVKCDILKEFKISISKFMNVDTLETITECNLDNYLIDANLLYLKEEFRDVFGFLRVGESDFSIKSSLVINERVLDQSKGKQRLLQEIMSAQKRILDLGNYDDLQSNSKRKYTSSVKQLEELKLKFNNNRLLSDIDVANKNIKSFLHKDKGLRERFKEAKRSVSEFDEIADLSEIENVEYNELSKHADELKKAIIELDSSYKNSIKLLNDVNISFDEMYSKDDTYFVSCLKDHFSNELIALIPSVVFWQNNEKGRVDSKTTYDSLLHDLVVGEKSKPIINILKISSGLTENKDVKDLISEIIANDNERSRKERILNREVNDYILSVWKDYDQEIKITLEKDELRIEIFDPERLDASYIDITERSQGAQAFLAFLLSVGVASRKEIITKMIILLDEPEAHLHPAGVRFMLRELIKISEDNNIVLFATHSIDMIDKSNYDRYVIVRKDKEATVLKPSVKDRIGYFMQEEVLYTAIDKDIASGYEQFDEFNFVFEGNGDARIFEYYYNNILNGKPPFSRKKCKYFQGGKCSNIQKYFKSRPIQLGTKWIFILDSDIPANNLKTFLESTYKDYLSKDIYVFQYESDKTKAAELEDLLSNEFMSDVFVEAFKECEIGTVDNEIMDCISKHNYSEASRNILLLAGKQSKEVNVVFKEMLNERIVSSLSDDAFQNEFILYKNWADNIINIINQE